MRAIPLTIGTIIVAAGLLACGRVKIPANWGGGPDQSVNNGDGAVTTDLPPPDLAPSPDLVGSVCAQCSINATCDPTNATTPCTCKGGFVGDGKTCTDVNECTLMAADCDPNATCNNTLGGFTCTCKPGFRNVGGGMGKAGECKENWLQQTLIDEASSGVPLDMGTLPAATATETINAASGTVVGVGSKLYLLPPRPNNCNDFTKFYLRSFDATTGKLASEYKAAVTYEICSDTTDWSTSQPQVASDNNIYWVGQYHYTRFDTTTRTFSSDHGPGAGGTWDTSALPYVNSKGVTTIGSTMYLLGGTDSDGSTRISKTYKLALGASTPTATQVANLPLPLSNPLAVRAGTTAYLVFGDKNGSPTMNNRLIAYDTVNNTYTPADATAWAAQTELFALNANGNPVLPTGIDSYSVKNRGGVAYKDQYWFISQDYSGSNNLLRLWAFDPVAKTWNSHGVLPSSLGTNENDVRLGATTGTGAHLYLLGKGLSALEIYQYNE